MIVSLYLIFDDFVSNSDVLSLDLKRMASTVVSNILLLSNWPEIKSFVHDSLLPENEGTFLNFSRSHIL